MRAAEAEEKARLREDCDGAEGGWDILKIYNLSFVKYFLTIRSL